MSTLETFKDTKIGRIPKEWDLVSFSQLGDYYGGISGKSKDDFGKGKKYIPFMNIMSNDVIDLDFMDFVDIKDDENQNQVMNGDLFFNTSSETPNEVGMCSVLKNCNEEIYLNSFCFGFRLNDKSGKQFIPEYIARFMRSNYGRKIMLPLAQGMTRYNLSKKYFLKLEIPIPILAEQKKIIEILSTVDQQISLTEKIIEKSKELKKGLMQKLFSEGIGHTEFKNTKIGRIPKDWEVGKLGDNCLKLTKKFEPSQSNDSHKYIGLEHIISNAHNINGYGDSNDTLSTKTIFKKGEILYGKLRPYLNKVWRAKFNGVCTTEILVLKSKNDFENGFLFYLLHSDRFIAHTISNTEGTSLPRANWKDIAIFKLPIPPLTEQQKIADILSVADAKIEKEQSKKDKLEELKRCLMQQLLTGKKRVKV